YKIPNGVRDWTDSLPPHIFTQSITVIKIRCQRRSVVGCIERDEFMHFTMFVILISKISRKNFQSTANVAPHAVSNNVRLHVRHRPFGLKLVNNCPYLTNSYARINSKTQVICALIVHRLDKKPWIVNKWKEKTPCR